MSHHNLFAFHSYDWNENRPRDVSMSDGRLPKKGKGKFALVYLKHKLIFPGTPDKQIDNIRQDLRLLQDAGRRLNLKK